MRTLLFTLLTGLLTGTTPAVRPTGPMTQPVTMSKRALQDKIKGGWAGQVIGCTFGGPTEFRFTGTMINDYQPIPWYDGYIRKTMTDSPGLYDDLYMDLTFVDVFEREGLDAPVSKHARAYAQAGYMLWHANQAGRYNILNGIDAPRSGHWLNNPHADDIDFQIEADFSGLMAPGMPNTAVQIGDSIGHIMNYGDGWYGGAYVGALYALAFVSTDIQHVVTEALKVIPRQSSFYRCIADVIRWHREYPTDWKRTWFELQRNWSDEVGCPDGVFHSFNIDAKLNAAYVVLGLLYGGGDYGRTLAISTRAGQDSDCNPSTAGGVLGTMLGYDAIPTHWKQGLADAETIDFKYTSMSLNDVYALGLKHALEVIGRNGGSITGDRVNLAVQTPRPVRLEQSFAGHYPVRLIGLNKDLTSEHTLNFDGIGFVLKGEAKPANRSSIGYDTPFAFEAELSIDDRKAERVSLPANFTRRRYDLFWKYQLPKGKHQVRIKLLNPDADHIIRLTDLLVYDDQPAKARY